MGPNQGNHLLVVKTQTGENVPNMAVVLGAVREAAVRGAASDVLVLTAGSPGDRRTAQLLNSTGASQSPEVGVRDPGELGLDWLQIVSGNLKTGIGAMVRLGGKSHSGAVASSRAGLLVISTASMPCQTEDNLSPASNISFLCSLSPTQRLLYLTGP